MKHKTWFRLVIKIIGIFLIATGGASLLDSIFTALGETLILRRFAAGGFGLSASFEDVLSFMLSAGLIEGIVRIAIGAYLLLGGVKLINFCIPSNRPYCPNCGYDVRGVSDEQCSECGIRLPAELCAAIQHDKDAKLTQSGGEALPIRKGFTRFVPPRNGRALIGYYFAIASLIPVVGIVLGPIAIFCGIEGIRHASKYPEHGGGAHGYFAVALGLFTSIANIAAIFILPLWLPQ